MSAKVPSLGHCRVTGAEKLPAGITNETICGGIAQAMDKQAPGVRYSVDVRVVSKSRLSAILVVNGRTFPAQNLAVSDGQLKPASIRRFAEAVAGMTRQH